MLDAAAEVVLATVDDHAGVPVTMTARVHVNGEIFSQRYK
jgi:hypothetical protein